MQQRTLGQHLKVSAVGYGAMGLSGVYGEADDASSIALLKSAFDLGVNFFDTADVYGGGHNEGLVGQAFKANRKDIVLATKAALQWYNNRPTELTVNNTPEYLKAACDASLQRLGTDYIDLYYIHRIDPQVPVAESIGALADLVKAGKIRYIGISEANSETIKKAHAIHPLTAVQSEYSLWSRDIESNQVLKTCNDLGIGFVAYSPLGRGFLTGTIQANTQLQEKDFRTILPRFQGENAAHNLKLVEDLSALAKEKNVTTAQLALAWVLSRGDHIVPIPGTKTIERLQQNIAAAELRLSCDEVEKIDQLFAVDHIQGARYSEGLMKTVDH